jgi:hypothetical protein
VWVCGGHQLPRGASLLAAARVDVVTMGGIRYVQLALLWLRTCEGTWWARGGDWGKAHSDCRTVPFVVAGGDVASSWLSHTQLPHLTATPPQAPAFNSNCLSLYLHIMLFTICLTDIEPWHQRLTTSAPLHIGPLPFTPFLSLAPHATLSTWSWTGLMKAGLSGPQICDQAHATCKYADGAHCCISSLPPYVSIVSSCTQADIPLHTPT